MSKLSALMLALSLLSISAMGQVWRPGRVVALDYPKSALVGGIEGTVEIECYIANDGRVIRAEPIRGDGDLAVAAIRNAMEWRFRRVGPGDEKYTLTYQFRMQKELDPPLGFRFAMPGQVIVTANAIAKKQ